MADEIEFTCPRCGGKAFYYPGSGVAGCLAHGWLLYTEIPNEIKTMAKVNRLQDVLDNLPPTFREFETCPHGYIYNTCPTCEPRP